MEDLTPQKFTEPVALSSTQLADRPLPRRAFELGFDLVALRARCSQNSRRGAQLRQGRSERTCRNLRSFLFARVLLRITPHALVPKGQKRGRARGPAANSPSRERFRPPSRRTFRFRVVLLGGLRPTGAPCSAQAGLLQIERGPSRAGPHEFSAICVTGFRAFRAIWGGLVSRSSPGRSSRRGAGRGDRPRARGNRLHQAFGDENGEIVVGESAELAFLRVGAGVERPGCNPAAPRAASPDPDSPPCKRTTSSASGVTTRHAGKHAPRPPAPSARGSFLRLNLVQSRVTSSSSRVRTGPW
jgi:hypothetical protein